MRFVVLSIIVLVANSGILNAKTVVNTYAEYKNWKIISGHSASGKKVFVCTLISKKNSFYISYSSYRGWVVTFGYKSLPPTVKGQVVSARVLVDGGHVATKNVEISRKKNIIHLPLGGDVKTLSKIVKSVYFSIEFGGEELREELPGLEAAFVKEVGCWRDRMDSVSYASKFSQELAKPQQTSKTYLKEVEAIVLARFLNVTNLSAYKVKNSNLYIANDSTGSVGYAFARDLKAVRMTAKDLSELANLNMNEYMKKCNKYGVERRRPFFTKREVEVHSRVSICEMDDVPIKIFSWLMHTEELLITLTIMTNALVLTDQAAEIRLIENIIFDIK